jgi:hypothetical protein
MTTKAEDDARETLKPVARLTDREPADVLHDLIQGARLVRHKPGTPVVRLPEPLPPEPIVVQVMQEHADRAGKPYTLPNGFTVTPREKKTRKVKPAPGWWLR